MMDKPVHDGEEEPFVAEDTVPLGHGQIGSDDDAALLVRIGNELKKKACAVDIGGKIAPFVDDEQ